ncbi:hypothetical protein Ahy_B02g061545 [Arachis hypogaea]|uniref:Uncharacterized protein n=1 Tax=Arachis hypogaea TaxID=3818 RepID=A0A445ALF8_ARAHY|nr:hypothetical protein Ahy_B02g061545 [Arachis hypogaea]
MCALNCGEGMIVVINDYSRMRLAVDLVYKWHNPKRDMIKEFAVANWNKKMQQSLKLPENVRVTKDNNILAIGMDDSSIQIYNVRVDEVKSKLKGHTKRITALKEWLHFIVQTLGWITDCCEKIEFRDWALPLACEKKFREITDSRLNGDYVEEELRRVVLIALICAQSQAEKRPTMLEVVELLKGDSKDKISQLEAIELFISSVTVGHDHGFGKFRDFMGL